MTTETETRDVGTPQWDAVAFQTHIAQQVNIIATHQKWATEEQTEIMEAAIQYWLQNDSELDIKNLRGFFRAFANMNGVYNRLAKKYAWREREKSVAGGFFA